MVQAAGGGALPFATPQKSPPAAKQQLDAFFADLERELEKVEFFRPEEKRGVMVVNLRNIFQRIAPTQQDIRTLHGVVTALAQGRKGPARGGVLDSGQAQQLRDLLAEHGRARAPSERTSLRGLPRLLRRNPTEAERTLWHGLVNDRRFAQLGFKRQVPIGRYVNDFVSFPLKCVIDLVPPAETDAASQTRAEKRAWLAERAYRIVDVNAGRRGHRHTEGARRSFYCHPDSLAFQRLDLRGGAFAQKPDIVADRDEAKAAFGHRQRACGIAAIDAGDLAGLVGGLTNAVDGAPDFRRLLVLRLAAAQGGGRDRAGR